MQAPPCRPAGLGSWKAVMLASAEVCLSWQPEIIRTEEGIWEATRSAKEDMVDDGFDFVMCVKWLLLYSVLCGTFNFVLLSFGAVRRIGLLLERWSSSTKSRNECMR